MSERASEDSQVVLPESFIALYRVPGRLKLSAPRAEIAERHEFCDDLAQMLTERAQTLLWELGVTEADVLQRVGQGLLDAGLQGGEPAWVLRRLAELLDWPWQADASEA